MGTKHHYVSKFFLASFTDPEVPPGRDPWLWVGSISDGTVKRRAPANIGWSRDLFAGPGGLRDREQQLEDFLAEQVEGRRLALFATSWHFQSVRR